MRRSQVITRFLLLASLIGAGLTFSRPVLACGEVCANDTDCNGSSCSYCDTDFGICSDCCEFTESVTCPSACLWNMGECRNKNGASCGINLPETPQASRYWFFVLLILSGILALGLGYRFRPKTKGATHSDK